MALAFSQLRAKSLSLLLVVTLSSRMMKLLYPHKYLAAYNPFICLVTGANLLREKSTAAD
jgi:hypothetical protein